MTTLSPKRLAEIAAIPDSAIDTSDIPEATAADFQHARGYTLTVSRYFAAFVTMWATQAGIDHTWNMPITRKGQHAPPPPLPRRIVFTFSSGAARAHLMRVARYKIAGLRKSPIATRLRDEYEMSE